MGIMDGTPLLQLDGLEMLGHGVDHAEGICVAPDGSVYVSGEAGQIYRLDDADRAVQVATTGGWTLGLAADADGRVYACDAVKRGVFRWAPGQTDPVLWSSGPVDAPHTSPNWGAFGPDGTYFVSDNGGWKAREGRVMAVRQGVSSVWTTESVDFPNGLAVTPDGSELWVVESTPGCLVRYRIQPDGSAGPRVLVTELPGAVPDGIAFATDGSVIIACYRPDVVLRWSGGSGVEVVAIDAEGVFLAAPTNCVFTGPARDIVLVPNIGRWHVTRFRIPGIQGTPLFYPTRDQLGS